MQLGGIIIETYKDKVSEGNTEKHKKKSNKIVIGIIISFSVLLIVYLGMSIFFSKHFCFGTVINNINAAGKTVDQVEEEILNQTMDYKLQLEGREDVRQEIKGSDIGLKYISDDKIQGIKDSQNGFAWIFSLFNKKDSQMDVTVSYDEELLKKSFDSLSYMNSNNIVETKSANLEYTDNGYIITPEVNGNKINKDILYKSVVKAILNEEKKIKLESIDCYEKPEYISSSQEIADAKVNADKYIRSIITYEFANDTETVNGSTIQDWINFDKDFNVTLDEAKVREYVLKLASKYNTYQKTRDFITTDKKTVKVSGGNYGWIIDKTKEMQDLIEEIKEGQTITKEPIYAQTAVSRGINDIGNSYLEINMTKQHAWFYKNGLLVADSDVVTGDMAINHGTPVGTYRLNYKEKDAKLRGPGYEQGVPVAYWMPFNNDIGLHDASWKTKFGGDIYLTDGSHGCINAPIEFAKKVFENIEASTPVICFNE